jgi:flagellar hook protein FlgE
MEAIFSGITGLQVNQQMLDVVGNNLANSNTTGFKSQKVNFADLVYQTIKEATAATGTTGGTDPAQVGSGAKVAQISANFQQGTLQSTGNEFDMALQGNGFFVARNANQQPLYTRDGSFGVDSQDYLVDPATGNRVQRFGTVGEGSATSPAFQTPGNNDIRIPVGTVIPGAATTNVVLQGNLSTSATGPLPQTLTSAQPFKSGGAAATATTTLNSLSDNTAPYVAGDSLTLQGFDAAGNAVNTTLAVGPASTLGDVVNAINTNFPGATASIDASGNLVVTANATGPSKLSVSVGDTAGNTGGTNWGLHLLGVTTTGKVGDTVSSSIQVYDAQGTAHALNLVFQKQSANTWNLTGQINPADGTMTDNQVNGLVFNPDGSFSQATGTGVGNATMTVQFAGMPTAQTLSFNFGSPAGFNGLTQTGGASSAAATSQDGYASGSLTSLSIGQDGLIDGQFSNGKTLAIAQLAVATFANKDALDRVGDNYFQVSSESGQAMIGAGLTGGRGSVQQKQLESSNVDISLEFTRLIIAQQGYQVNAHVITTADQVLQALTNILR